MKKAKTILEVPGYTEALSKERLVRECAMLCEHERIGEFRVRPLSLRMYSELRLVQSPFIYTSVEATYTDLVQFLWRISPEFTRGESRGKRKFFRHCLKLMAKPAKPFFETKRAIRRWEKKCAAAIVRLGVHMKAAIDYRDEALMDSPGGSGSGGIDPYCDDCAIVARLARAYGWQEQAILDMPLKAIFQFLRECRHADYIDAKIHGLDAQAPSFMGYSDNVIGNYLRDLNKSEGLGGPSRN